MLKAYFYPHSKIKTTTPYFNYFMDGLEDRFMFLNRQSPSGIGIIDMIKYLPRINVAFLNFPEDMIDKRYGHIQFILFTMFILPLMKLSGKKIVWTMHNSRSHAESNKRVKKFLYSMMIRRSDIIVMHSLAGKPIVAKQHNKHISKVFYFPHPVMNMKIKETQKSPVFDYIIWGAIAPYKGVDTFVKFIHDHPEYHDKKILIVGKIKTTELEEVIKKHLTNNIKLINRFVDDEELKEYIQSSKAVLFPYNHDSVLASGALVYSINFRRPVIGPATGAFKDLAEDGLVFNFKDYPDIFQIDTSRFSKFTFDDYVQKVNWTNYLDELFQYLRQII